MDVTPLSGEDVRMRLGIAIVVMMLSLDVVNPVKVVCSIITLDSAYVFWTALVSFLVVVYTNGSEMMYFCTKIFLQSICSIFFSSIEVLGKQNIPKHGPIIFTGNHMNQFVDAAVMIVSCPYRVGFLIADKSFKTRIIGDFARAVGAYPVMRPQDYAIKGKGKVFLENCTVCGQGTEFLSLNKADKIRIGKSAEAYRIVNIVSDTELILASDDGGSSPASEINYQGIKNITEYDILAYIDQGKVFQKVQEALSEGNNLGIFPEGGSHDNTDLLPLKVGISAITFGVLDKYDVNVPIVPVGLNYFKGHRFRGRVVVEFGEPIMITQPLHDTYKESKRVGYQTLLQQVEDGMRSVLVTAGTYDELKLIHTTRRLFQRASSGKISTIQKQDMARRFAAAYRLLKERYVDSIPKDLELLQKHLEAYQDLLDELGVRDYQVVNGNAMNMTWSRILYIFGHVLVIMILASLPSLVLNAPVGLAAKYWSFQEAQKDLKKSRVKLAARDVLLSKKIMFSIVAVPCLWVFYAWLLFYFSHLETRTIVVLLLCFPIFSYISVISVQAGMVGIKDLRPAFLRLFPNYRNKLSLLPKMRTDLQLEVRNIVKKYGPSLGAIYTDETRSWENSVKRSSSNPLLVSDKKSQ